MKTSRIIKPLFILALLLGPVFVSVFPKSAKGFILTDTSPETRYMRGEEWSNTLNILSTNLTDATFEQGFIFEVPAPAKWGIRVWINDTELTWGVPVAEVTRLVGSGAYFVLSNTWVCPFAMLNQTSVIIVRVYGFCWSWLLFEEVVYSIYYSEFQTEIIPHDFLKSTTWTVYYWLSYVGNNDEQDYFYGYSSYLPTMSSKITNIVYQDIFTPPTETTGLSFSSGVVFVGVMAACVCVVVLAAGLSLKKRR